jgi:site-specific DNA-methyltransferase (adenine-specific)
MQLIENSSVKGETVLDPFAGSGSTLVAAIKLGRQATGCEVDEKTYQRALSYIGEELDGD